jgi:transposase
MIVIGADTHKSTHTFAAVVAVRVAPKMMGQTHRGERRPGKSDEIDALAIARAAVREGLENRPNAFLDEQAFEIRLLHELTRGERALEREPTAAIKDLRPDLLAEPGIGPTTAATLIGRTAGAERFPSDGHFARQAGVAPIPASSGRTTRVRLNRGGDRQLNCACNTPSTTMALT